MWVPIGSPPFSFMRWNREQKLEPRDGLLSEHLYERQKYKAGTYGRGLGLKPEELAMQVVSSSR